MPQYDIGHEIEHAGSDPTQLEKYRVVRIVGRSVSLFQNEKEVYLQTESYVELKSINGTIAFAILNSERAPYEGPPSLIKALDPINFEGSNI